MIALFISCYAIRTVILCLYVPVTGSKLGLGDVQAELDRISSREMDSDLPSANETPAADGQDT